MCGEELNGKTLDDQMLTIHFPALRLKMRVDGGDSGR